MSHARLVTFVPKTLDDAWRKLVSSFEALHHEAPLGRRGVVYTSNATPNTEDTVPHGLERVPSGFIVTSIDKAGVVYKSSAFDATNLKLKCSVASAAVTLHVVE